MKIKKINKVRKEENIRIEEIMSDKPRKYSGQGNPNIYIACYQSLAKKENWSDDFFQQFHTVAVDEAHQSKSTSLINILERTFGYAYNRFGVSGTFPDEMSAEALTIGSVIGPVVNSIKAKKLQKEGKISMVKVKQITLNHDDPTFNQQLIDIRKIPNQGARAYQLESEYVRNSEKRMEFISKLTQKCKSNTLVLFNIIEYGERLRDRLIEDLDDDIEVLYIDGSVKKKDREEIKKKMEENKKEVEYTILNFGDYELEVESNFNLLLYSGKYKEACDITPDDDIDDNFLKNLRNTINGDSIIKTIKE